MSTLISVIIDGGKNIQGYLAIDSTINGRSYGGLRIAPDITPATLAELARVMTLKHSFLGLPLGGAKAAIVADPEAPLEEKRRLLKAFGGALEPFLKTRSYVPNTDMGTTGDDITYLLNPNSRPSEQRRLRGVGFFTGLTVLTSAIRAAKHIGLDTTGASVAVEGFGKIGSSVARAFWEKGFRVVAISTGQGAIYSEKGLDIDELCKLYDQLGSGVVKAYRRADQMEKSGLLELEVDFLSPCANSYSINSDNASRIRARIISPGANAPTTPEAEQILFEKGIVSLPDFIANCGVAMGAAMMLAGLSVGYIAGFIEERFGDRVSEVIEAADKEHMIPRVYAEKIAMERFWKIKERTERGGFVSRGFDFALGLYRKGLIPRQLVRLLSPGYFERRLG